MKDLHIIPIIEIDLHVESERCPCHPKREVTEGKIVWIHLDVKDLIDQLDVL